MASRRLFFALWPDGGGRERLLQAARELDVEGSGRAVAGVDLHVTLCFLGAVEERLLAGLCERAAAASAAGFTLRFDALEYWPQSRTLVASGSHVPAAASALAHALNAVARAFGLAADHQQWRPHVTLRRGAAAPAGWDARARPLSPPPQLAARRFYLAQSHELEAATATAPQTARYTPFASWPLTMAEG